MSEDLNPDKTSFEEENELYEHYRFTVDNGQQPYRIDRFITQKIENATRNKVQNAARAGNILVNGDPVKPNYRIKPGDIISIVLAYPPREIEIIPEKIPVEIQYEDDDLLIVNKTAGMVVHPGHGNYRGTLVNALTYYLREERGITGGFPLLVHRIDKDTSGILAVAKNEVFQSKMAKLFYNHDIDRKYHALVWGDFDADEGTISGHIGRNTRDRKLRTVYPDNSRGKHAVTHYRVLKRFRYVTLVECTLETGRTHQIRVHFRHIGHPLFNDAEYGGNMILKGTTFTRYRQFIQNCFKLLPRQALHAKSLGFKHPTTGEKLFFDSDLPEDMRQVIEKWERYTSASGDTFE